MSRNIDAEHAYFARVPNKLLADLRSPTGPPLTYVAADAQLHVNHNALTALHIDPDTGDKAAPVVVAPILFTPNNSLASNRKEPRAR